MRSELLRLHLSRMACVYTPGSALGQPESSTEQRTFQKQRKRWGRDGGEMGCEVSRARTVYGRTGAAGGGVTIGWGFPRCGGAETSCGWDKFVLLIT